MKKGATLYFNKQQLDALLFALNDRDNLLREVCEEEEYAIRSTVKDLADAWQKLFDKQKALRN